MPASFMKKKADITFGWNDPWLLLALINAGKGATARDIISVADYLNRAVISFDDMARGLGRLIAGGCAFKRAGKFYAAIDARRFHDARAGRRGSASFKAMEEYLGMAEAPRGPRDATDCGAALTGEEYEEAVREYLNGF